MGLVEAEQRGVPLKVIIFHNRVAAATGGQPIGPDVFEKVLGGYADHVRRIAAPVDPVHAEQVLSEAKASDRLQIVVVETP